MAEAPASILLGVPDSLLEGVITAKKVGQKKKEEIEDFLSGEIKTFELLAAVAECARQRRPYPDESPVKINFWHIQSSVTTEKARDFVASYSH